MEQLWAPWRLEYIKSDKEKGGCPFCDLPQIGATEESLILYQDEQIFVVLNKFPYNPGHLLIIPREHVSMPGDLNPKVWVRLSKATQLCVDIQNRAQGPQGFNVGMNIGAVGGAGIPGHLHWHVLPRWAGDTNFMPLLAETKAIPTHNQSIYQSLKPFFADFASALDKK